MRIIDRYLGLNVSYPSVAIISLLSAIILITQSLKYVDLIVSYGTSGSDFLYVTALLIPSLLSIIIPICFFIAVIYSLAKLSSQRELNILKSVGIDNFSIGMPVLKVAVIITIFHLCLTLYFTPLINRKFKTLTKDLKENYITFFIQEKVFNHPTKFLTIYIRNKISDTNFEQIFYQDSRHPNNPITLIAEKGELTKKDDQIYFNLIEGNRQELNNKGELTTLFFNTMLVKLDFSKNPNNFRELTMQEKNFFELLFPKENVHTSQRIRMFAEATHRLTWPLYNLILSMLAIITILGGEFNRAGKRKRLFYFATIAGIVVIIHNSLISLGSTYFIGILLSYGFTLSIFGLLTYSLAKK